MTRPRGARCATGSHTTAVVTAKEVGWLVARLRVVVAASPTAWAGRGMTLVQLTALHFISAQAPVTLAELALALGARSPATSVMVDRLISIGLVCRAPDPRDGRWVALRITDRAEPMVGDVDLDTARRLQAALHGMTSQARRDLIDVLRDTVGRSAGPPTQRPIDL